MSRTPPLFKQSELTKMLKAFKAAGIPIARVEVGEGKIVLVTNGAQAESGSELEKWMVARAGTP